MPVVSVIIPTYRRADLLPDTLRSVQEQSFQDFEIVVVDDHSDDRGATRRVVDALNDPRITCFELDRNGGAPAALNAALPHCHGELLSFVDSDDLMRPRKLEDHVAIFRDHPELALVYSDELLMDSAGRVTAEPVRAGRVLPSGSIAPEFFNESFIGMMTVTVRRSVFVEVGGFDASLKWNYDDDLWFRIMLTHEVRCSGYVAGIRRLHESNMSADRTKMTWFQLECIAKYMTDYPDFIAAHRALVQNRTRNIFRGYFGTMLAGNLLPDPAITRKYRDIQERLAVHAGPGADRSHAE